jgi:hypothetical protein
VAADGGGAEVLLTTVVVVVVAVVAGRAVEVVGRGRDGLGFGRQGETARPAAPARVTASLARNRRRFTTSPG